MAAHPSTTTTSATSTGLTDATHRLPTFSASQALQALQNGDKSCLSSGIPALDRAISGDDSPASIGLERGKVVEIWGPSGAGKTAIASSVAAQAIKHGESVAWIDGKTPLSILRLNALQHGQADETGSEPVQSGGLHHFSVPTLSHLLALILHPPSWFPPPNCGLLIIDGLNALIDPDYPRFTFTIGNRTEQQKLRAGRRYAVLGSVAGTLGKLAVLHSMPIIITTGCSSRMRSDSGFRAALGPGVGGSEWDAGVSARLAVLRDFSGRFICVQKCRGRNLLPIDPTAHVGNLISFEIGAGGIAVAAHSSLPDNNDGGTIPAGPDLPSSTDKAPLKRSYDEIADSDDESLDAYGWLDADADVTLSDPVGEQREDLTI